MLASLMERERWPVLLPQAPLTGEPRVLVVSGSVGSGHDGVADELTARLRGRGLFVQQRDYLDALPSWGKVLLREGYTSSVSHAPALFEWLFGAIERPGTPASAATQWLCSLAGPTLQGWLEEGVDAVVSTYPFASWSLGQLRARGGAPMALVTVLTDPAAHRFWVHDRVDHHVTVSAATAAQGQLQYGITMRAGGTLVPPAFEQRCSIRRARVREELRLRPEDAMALMTTGSLGIGDVAAGARALARSGVAVPVVLCGRNQALRQQLDVRLSGTGARVLGWRPDMPDMVNAADVLVHNAGGQSLSEAWAARVPAVSFSPLPGHGRANAAVLEQSGLVPWARNDAELPAMVATQMRTRPSEQPGLGADLDTTAFVADLAANHCQGRQPPTRDGRSRTQTAA